jgi:hypothetical protein
MRRGNCSLSAWRARRIADAEPVQRNVVNSRCTACWTSFHPQPGGCYRVEVIPGNVASGEFVIDAASKSRASNGQ